VAEFITNRVLYLHSKKKGILPNLYLGEELLRFHEDVRNPKRIRKESPKYFLGSIYPCETLKVVPLVTGSVIYLFFRV
jgi:hypothetical protein